MDKQKARSRSQSEFKISEDNIDWVSIDKKIKHSFIGYSESSSKSKIVKYRNLSDDKYEIILDSTPFYAESGGQIGDIGYIENDNLKLKVLDTQKIDERITHICILERGEIKLNEKVEAMIDTERRLKIRSNHTATHLLHESLKQVLGEHVQQSGSLVNDKKLRFDLTPVSYTHLTLPTLCSV